MYFYIKGVFYDPVIQKFREKKNEGKNVKKESVFEDSTKQKKVGGKGVKG